MKTTLILLATITLAANSLLAQGGGPLTPPGAPGVTMKTLQEIEPRIPLIPGAANTAAVTTNDAAYHFVILRPGSYYLTGNLDVTKSNGIFVRSAGVTLDLGGFEIRRTSGARGNGIEVESFAARCTVKNGTIRGFDYGLRVPPGSFLLVSSSGTVSQLAVTLCATVGIEVSDGWEVAGCEAHRNGIGIAGGNGVTIAGCTAYQNTGDGISAGTGATIARCTSSENAGGGFSSGGGSTITGCAASKNTGGTGILAGTGSTITGSAARDNSGDGMGPKADGPNGASGSALTITDCAASGNGQAGLLGGTDSVITNCTARSNVSFGIFGSVVTQCTASSNGNWGILGDANGLGAAITHCVALSNSSHGIFSNAGSTITGCTANQNTGDGIRSEGGSTITGCTTRANTASGIVGFGGSIAGCSAVSNGLDGISGGDGSTISDCTANSNTGDGITAGSECVIRANTCAGNGDRFGNGDGAGIHATGDRNRIEGNNATNSDRGIDVDGGNNVIVKNTASGNLQNYNIVGGNFVGTTVIPPPSAPMMGTSGAAGVGTTDPWANLSSL